MPIQTSREVTAIHPDIVIKVIPVVVGSLGVVKKGTDTQINEIPGNSNLQEIQNTTLVGTAHVLRRVFSIK